jgi:hypothetical protein
MNEQALPNMRQGTVSKYYDNANLEGLEQARFPGSLGDGSVLPEMSIDVQDSKQDPRLCAACRCPPTPRWAERGYYKKERRDA